MNDLLTVLREHDLPPKWDGRIVMWRGWEASNDELVFICPPPKAPECCTNCGSIAPSVDNRGYAARHDGVTREQVDDNEAARERLPMSLRHKIKPLVWLELLAFRCPDCKHDVIWDTRTDLWWDLDHTDYGPDGSS